MKKICVGFVISLIIGVSFAGFTPGKYELQNIGGRRLGEVQVTLTKTTFQSSPAWKMEIKTRLDGAPKGDGEDEEAFIDGKGLAYCRKQIRKGGVVTLLEGERDAEKITIRKKAGEAKSIYGVPLSLFDLSVYEMDLDKSPFFQMSLRDRKGTLLFSLDDLAAVKSVRIISERRRVNFGRKEIEVFVANTSVGNKVYQSWFDVNTHDLIYERGPDQILRRME